MAPENLPKMQYVRLGKTGMRVSNSIDILG